MTTQARTSVGMILGLLALIAVSLNFVKKSIDADYERNRHNVFSEFYGGTVTTTLKYEVKISENLEYDGRRNTFTRTVEMRALDTDSLQMVTGAGSNAGDLFHWSRVSFCGARKPGDLATRCNAVDRASEGWNFDPNPVDKNFAIPFSQDEIDDMIVLLGKAMIQVRNPEHLQKQEVWDTEKQKVVTIYPLPVQKASN